MTVTTTATEVATKTWSAHPGSTREEEEGPSASRSPQDTRFRVNTKPALHDLGSATCPLYFSPRYPRIHHNSNCMFKSSACILVKTLIYENDRALSWNNSFLLLATCKRSGLRSQSSPDSPRFLLTTLGAEILLLALCLSANLFA